MPKKMMEAACPPECGFTMRWNEGDFNEEEMEQLFELAMKHMVRSHGYQDTPETREMLKKKIKTIEK